MRDVTLIVEALAEAEARGEQVVLATVARTEGSTYRRAGAASLLRAAGACVLRVPMPEAATDIDTPVDLDHLRAHRA